MGGNDAGQMNDVGALRTGQSYAQPPTPSERCNNLRKANRELREKLAETEAARDRAIDKIIELATEVHENQQSKGDHMPDEFKTGDLVRLKSGGPLMTVRNRKAPSPSPSLANAYLAQGGGYSPAAAAPSFERPVTCDWFTTDEIVMHTSCFEEEQLKKVGPVTLANALEKATAATSGGVK